MSHPSIDWKHATDNDLYRMISIGEIFDMLEDRKRRIFAEWAGSPFGGAEHREKMWLRYKELEALETELQDWLVDQRTE